MEGNKDEERLKSELCVCVDLVPDVNDDADRPHVQGSVVAFVPQHLGRQVGRRADHRAPERLLSDDPGKSKVTQLHLQRWSKTLALETEVVLI